MHFYETSSAGHQDYFYPYLHKVIIDDYADFIDSTYPPAPFLTSTTAFPFMIHPLDMIMFTVPVEHFLDSKWLRLETFVEILEKMIRVI
jgi:hypothetical protein